MAYFPNGTTGDMYEEQYCHKCVNWRDRDGLKDYPGCPVLDLHLMHNYDQNKKTKTGKIIEEFLSTLIPMQKDRPFADECSMFMDRDFVQQSEATYLENLRFADEPVFGANV